MNLPKHLLIFLIVFFSYCTGVTQKAIIESDKNEVFYKHNENGNYIEGIEFKNLGRNTNSVVLNIFSDNPYNKLDFPILELDNYGGKIYDLSNANFDRIRTEFSFPNYTLNHKINSAQSSAYIYSKGKKFTTISYTLSFYNQSGHILGIETFIKIFNSKGEIVGKIHDKETGAYITIITEDGNFVLYQYGGEYGCHNEYLEAGFKIYDTNSGKEIYKISTDDKTFGNPYTKDGVIILVERAENGAYRHHIYDFNKMIKYEKDFYRGHRPKSKDITRNSLKYKNKGNEMITLFYEKDFKIEKLKN